MFYRRPSRWNRLRRHPALHVLLDFAAGLHAGHGLAHGVPPARDSAVRAAPDGR